VTKATPTSGLHFAFYYQNRSRQRSWQHSRRCFF